MFPKRCMILLTCILFCMIGTTVAAQEPYDVTITPIDTGVRKTRTFVEMVEVAFHDPALYHEGVHLSYHIYGDPEMTNLLQFENARVVLEPDAYGTAIAEISVDAQAFNLSDLYIAYDLVDTVGLFWFSENPSISMKRGVNQIQYSRLYEGTLPLRTVLKEQPLTLLLNTLVCCLIVATFIYVHKKRLLVFKQKQPPQPTEGG